jgi:cyanophycin synthetase
MNIFSVPAAGGEVSIVIDLAHNEAGLEALLEIMDGIRPPGHRLLLGLGAVGDRTDEIIERLGEIGAMGADVVAIGHKQRYLRGRTLDGLELLLRRGAERVGVTDVTAYPTEVECLAALVEQAGRDDVVGLMCHAQRQEAYDWIAEHGGTSYTPERLGEKVRAARR